MSDEMTRWTGGCVIAADAKAKTVTVDYPIDPTGESIDSLQKSLDRLGVTAVQKADFDAPMDADGCLAQMRLYPHSSPESRHWSTRFAALAQAAPTREPAEDQSIRDEFKAIGAGNAGVLRKWKEMLEVFGLTIVPRDEATDVTRQAYVMAMSILQSDLYVTADDELRVAVDAALARSRGTVTPGSEVLEVCPNGCGATYVRLDEHFCGSRGTVTTPPSELEYLDFLLAYDGELVIRAWDHDGRRWVNGQLLVHRMKERGGKDETVADALRDAMKVSKWREVGVTRSGSESSSEAKA